MFKMPSNQRNLLVRSTAQRMQHQTLLEIPLNISNENWRPKRNVDHFSIPVLAAFIRTTAARDDRFNPAPQRMSKGCNNVARRIQQPAGRNRIFGIILNCFAQIMQRLQTGGCNANVVCQFRVKCCHRRRHLLQVLQVDGLHMMGCTWWSSRGARHCGKRCKNTDAAAHSRNTAVSAFDINSPAIPARRITLWPCVPKAIAVSGSWAALSVVSNHRIARARLKL